MFKCYESGKLNDDAVHYIQNMHNMIKTAREIRKLGISVYIPCLDILEGLVDGNFFYEDYFNNSQPWLECADFMFVCKGWKTSEGTKKEIEYAKSIGKLIFFDLETLKYAIDHHGI